MKPKQMCFLKQITTISVVKVSALKPGLYLLPLSVLDYEYLMALIERLHSNEMAHPEYTTVEKEGQEAEESKFGINISAHNPQSECSTGMIIQYWLAIQFHRVLLPNFTMSEHKHQCLFP